MERLLALVLALPLTGCYLSHEPAPGPTDARPPARDVPDAAPPPVSDVGPVEGRYWTLDPVGVTVQARCRYVAGDDAWVRVTPSVYSPCQHPGPVEVEGRGPEWTLRATVWTEHGSAFCPSEVRGSFEQEVMLPDAAPGENRVLDEDSRMLAAIYAESPAPGCGPSAPDGAECAQDCGCASGVCAGVFGDVWCGSFCGTPCASDLECEPRRCAPDGLGGAVCVERTEDACSTSPECPTGLECLAPEEGPAVCDWALEMPTERCRVDEDCEPGASCVEESGWRACGVRCASTTMRCPAWGGCMRSSFGGGGPWTCGIFEG